MHNYAKLGTFGIFALVALRVCIGWHFYMEGYTKVKGRNFSSVGFLENAQGPLADNYRAMIWDHKGLIRLDQTRIVELFKSGADQASNHFALTSEQQKSLVKVRDKTIEKLNEVYAGSKDEIVKYLKSQQRFENMENSPAYNLASLHGQRESIERELFNAVKPTMATVDALWTLYEQQLNSIANKEQFAAAGYFRFQRPNQNVLSTRTVDKIIPIFDMCIGILLIIGLLTPVAASLAAAFLLSVILSQMPGYPGSVPTYFQAVECLALVALAATDAGRYAGLDFIPWAWWNRKSKTATKAALA